jgi:hypothetical protein
LIGDGSATRQVHFFNARGSMRGDVVH